MVQDALRIAVDAMGGDFAPTAAITGAYRAAVEDGISILLVGDEAVIGSKLADLGPESDSIEVVHAAESVGMDEPATTPIRKKPESSIRIFRPDVSSRRSVRRPGRAVPSSSVPPISSMRCRFDARPSYFAARRSVGASKTPPGGRSRSRATWT